MGRGNGNMREATRRVFGDGENPMNWSLRLYRAWRIDVRIHLFFLIYIAAELAHSMLKSQIGVGHRALGLGCLFGLVLLHEYGHCIACRRIGGDADRILLWPLGGLASCVPPHTWRAHLITTLGGPGVNAILLPIFGGLVWWLAGRGSAVFNPFDPGTALLRLRLADGSTPYWLVALWWLHLTNFALLAFNMLLPMYPMDCGRTVQAVLWARVGYRRSMTISLTLGLFVAIALAIVAVVGGEMTLLGLALFGGLTCVIEKQQMAATDGESPGGYDFSQGYRSLPAEEDDSRARARAEKAALAEAQAKVEIDRILSKIATSGMGSLSSREKRALEGETTRKRRESTRRPGGQ